MDRASEVRRTGRQTFQNDGSQWQGRYLHLGDATAVQPVRRLNYLFFWSTSSSCSRKFLLCSNRSRSFVDDMLCAACRERSGDAAGLLHLRLRVLRAAARDQPAEHRPNRHQRRLRRRPAGFRVHHTPRPIIHHVGSGYLQIDNSGKIADSRVVLNQVSGAVKWEQRHTSSFAKKKILPRTKERNNDDRSKSNQEHKSRLRKK
jgi:hypothetical protein